MLTFRWLTSVTGSGLRRETAEEVGADVAMGAQHRLRRDRCVRLSLLDTEGPCLNY